MRENKGSRAQNIVAKEVESTELRSQVTTYTQKMPSNVLSEVSRLVTVAPLVLLSVVDHYNRTIKNTKKRCVGIVLGESSPKLGTIRITNSFAVPFEEDDKNPSVFFLDHNYIDTMSEMFKKINAKERVIGWYHSGPKLRSNDLKINELFKKYHPDPVLLVVNVNQDDDSSGLPTDAYLSVQEIKEDGTETEKTFVHVPSSIVAEEPEEIGVEHLLREIRDQAQGLLSVKIANQLKSLRGLSARLQNVISYLERVLEGLLPINHLILGKLQIVFNLLPNVIGANDEKSGAQITEFSELNRALQVKSNDNIMNIYIGLLINAIILFHDLIENKIENKNRVLKSVEKEEEDESKKEEGSEKKSEEKETSDAKEKK